MLVVYHVTNRAYSIMGETRTHVSSMKEELEGNDKPEVLFSKRVLSKPKAIRKTRDRTRGVIYYVLLCSFRLDVNIYSYSKHRGRWRTGEGRYNTLVYCNSKSMISHWNHISM